MSLFDASNQSLSRRRGLSVTSPDDAHDGSPAKRGPAASLFNFNDGAAKPAMSLFGQTSTSNTQQSTSIGTSAATPSTPGLFGAPSSGVLASSGGSWLGNTTAAAPTPFTLGGTSAAAPSTSLFGGTAPTSGAAPSTSLFGSTAAAPGTTSLFGSSIPAPSTSLFGASTTAPTSTPLFGSAPAAAGPTSLFGASSKPAATTSLFGSTTAQPQPFGSSQLGSAPSSVFGQSTFNSQQPPQQQQQAQQYGLANYQQGSLASSTMLGAGQRGEVSFQDRLMIVKNSWDRSSPSCRFQYFFYNVVPPEQVHLYGRPQLATNDLVWQAAVRGNPDSQKMVPVMAVGFSDLKRRVDAQNAQALAHVAKLDEFSTSINQLSRKHALDTVSRLHKLTQIQSQLSARLCSLIAKIGPLTLVSTSNSSAGPAALGSSVSLGGATSGVNQSVDDDVLLTRLLAIKDESEGRVLTLHGSYRPLVPHNQAPFSHSADHGIGRRSGAGGVEPGCGGGGKAKMGELWAIVSQRKSMMESVGYRREESGWVVSDEAELNRVVQTLATQQQGLDHLALTVRKGQEDVKFMRKSFGLPA